MKQSLLLSAVAALLVSGPAPRAEARQPAGTRFHSAYRTLIRADIARDEKRFGDAIELYQTSADTYTRLMREYPDWEPGATRFRHQHCHQELKRLRRLENEGLIKPSTGGERATSTSPAPVAVPVQAGGLHGIKVTAVRLMDAGRPEEARQALLDGMDLNPDDAGLRVLLGIAQCQAGRHHDALFLLRNLVEEEPHNAHAHAALGTAYFGLARYADAAVEMKKASDSSPALSAPHFNLAQILLATEPPDTGGAAYHYRKALRLGAKRDAGLERRLATASEPEEEHTSTPARVRPKALSKPPSSPSAPTPAPMIANPEKITTEGATETDADGQKKTWLRSIAPW